MARSWRKSRAATDEAMPLLNMFMGDLRLVGRRGPSRVARDMLRISL